MVPYGERSRFEEALKEKGPPFLPDEWGAKFHAPGGHGGNHHAVGTPLRSLSWRRSRHRSSPAPPADPRDGRAPLDAHDRRAQAVALDVAHPFLGVRWQYAVGVARAHGGQSVRFTHGLTSCSEWTGVALSLLLREAGAHKGAAWIVAEGADATGNERSIPMAKAMDDVLVAYGQNGEAPRPGNGYPLRLIVPGWEGNVNVKWLRRIKVVDRPYMTRMEAPDHTSLLPNGKARQFLFVMEAKSVITFPSGGQRLPGPGVYEIRGLAWSGRGFVRRVEISTNGGKTWRGGTAPGARPPIRPHALRARLAVGRAGGRSPVAVYRRDRLRPAEAGRIGQGPRLELGLSQQRHPELEGAGRREHPECPRVSMRLGLGAALLVVTSVAGSGALAQMPTYGVGRAPTAEELKAWDLTIPPDGQGLPPGQRHRGAR